MSWQKVKLGDVCEITSSKRIFYSEYVDNGIPFFRSKEIIEMSNNQSISEPLFISEKKFNEIKEKFGIPQENDLLLTSVGTIGIPYIVKKQDEFYFKDGNLTWFKNFSNNLLSKYLCFWLKSDNGKGILNNTVIGSSQKALTISALKKILIPLPPIETQKKIADILSNYDDLIENNQKQIKLLEEAAQRLYKKWFVDFQFPGHETTPIINSLPQGWKKGRVEDIGGFSRGKTITKAKVVNGNVPVVAGGLEPAYYHNVSNTHAPVITVSGSGANAGFTKLYYENIYASDCSYLDINNSPYIYFVYCFLTNNKDSIDNMQKGSAQPHVYAKDINSLSIIIPSEKHIKEFCKIASFYFNKIKILKSQINKLTEARDRLLPKLMNEEIEV